jgi:hypothetical protein
MGESGGFVETEAGFWMGGRILSRVTLNLLEEPVHDAQVVVVVRIEARAEAVQETDRAHGYGSRSRGTGLPQGGPEGPEEDVEDGAGGSGPVVEEGPETFGHGRCSSPMTTCPRRGEASRPSSTWGRWWPTPSSMPPVPGCTTCP